MMGFSSLTIICSSTVFADKRHTSPRLSLVNVNDLNKFLKSEVFVSEDRQLRAVHLILDFHPISEIFQEVGHTIRASDPRLRRIDIFIPRFLPCEDIVPVGTHFVPILLATAAPREETVSSRLSLKKEINKFRLKEEEDQGDQIIPISDAKDEPDRLSSVHAPILVVALPDSSSKEKKEEMALNQKKGLRDLLARRNKGSTSKEVPKSQTPPNLPFPPPPHITNLGLLPILNLKKKRTDQELKEREVVPQKGTKQ